MKITYQKNGGSRFENTNNNPTIYRNNRHCKPLARRDRIGRAGAWNDFEYNGIHKN